MVQEGDYQVIKVTQKSFISEMDTGKVDKGRLQDDQLNSAKWKEFSSVNDGWQSNRADKRADKPVQPWPGNHIRTHAGALQHHRRRESTPESGLVFYSVPMDRSTTLVAYSDSSWANARQSKSQMGEDQFWIGRADGDGPRVTRSTLASEANAPDEAIDRLTYSNNHFLIELLYDQDTARSKPMLKQVAATDCKSLFDAVISANPSLSEKRTLIAVRSVQDFLSSEDIRWIPTGVMRADGLTTVNAQLHDEFRRWLQRPTITLRQDKAAPDWQQKNTSV